MVEPANGKYLIISVYCYLAMQHADDGYSRRGNVGGSLVHCSMF